jgi:hypothetical protein
MPEYAYAGATPRSYVETRDAAGNITGSVAYGDTREFDREWEAPEPADGGEPQEAPEWWPAPDADWFPAGADLPVRLPAEERAGEEAPAAPAASGTGDSSAAAKGTGNGRPAAAPQVTPRPPVTPAVTPPSVPATPAASGGTEEN